MRRWLRMIPVVLMGSLAIAYVLARPGLVRRAPYLPIFEFPVGALLIGLLLWAALARRERAKLPEPWRKHAQVVRLLPDPAVEKDTEVLDRWVGSGEAPEAAADVLARASSPDPIERDEARARYLSEISAKTSRRKREQFLKQHIEGV